VFEHITPQVRAIVGASAWAWKQRGTGATVLSARVREFITIATCLRLGAITDVS
jgi:hypothetical protein